MWMAQSTPILQQKLLLEAADQTLTSNLDTEITRARAAEALNTSDISNAQSQINAIATVKGSILGGRWQQ
jgi:hypothetical protein